MPKTRFKIDTREPSLVRCLRELVLFRSDRPEDRRGIADLAAGWLAGLGGKVSRHGDPAAPALLATFGKGGVLFSGHIDTVPRTGEWKTRAGEVRGGRMYGRGTTDMKGGVAAILGAASELIGRVPFSIALTTDEETGMAGAKAMLAAPALKACSFVVVAEPTGLKVGLAEKAGHFLRLETTGKSAHASMPWTGTSANERMLDLLAALRKSFPFRSRDGITFNVGVLRGGVKGNVIPDHCVAELDFRVPGALTPGPFESRVRAVLKSVRVPHTLKRLHWITALAQKESHPELRRFGKIAARPRTTIYFATEAAIFAALRKPCVIFGPGEQETAHITDEWVKLKELSYASRVYRDFALEHGGRP
jgi:acetylornithine deacetylase/succinyl-diaminopimelate desuccinylase-like protein